MYVVIALYIELAQRVGISEATLYIWHTQLRKEGRPVPEHDRSSENWSAQTKFAVAVVVETSSMSEIELSEYCRAKCLFPEQIKQWHDISIQAHAEPGGFVDAASAQRNKVQRKQIKCLEREALRKDKALAEAAALLILQKKSPRPLGRQRGQLTPLAHREQITAWAQQARNDGASLYRSCEEAGISVH